MHNFKTRSISVSFFFFWNFFLLLIFFHHFLVLVSLRHSLYIDFRKKLRKKMNKGKILFTKNWNSNERILDLMKIKNFKYFDKVFNNFLTYLIRNFLTKKNNEKFLGKAFNIQTWQLYYRKVKLVSFFNNCTVLYKKNYAVH